MEGLSLSSMIDPTQPLAFSVHSSPGVYALLLGSGVSRSARIPTGWEITLDLTRKLAGTLGESAEPNPETWFEEKYGEAPDYSNLLDALAKTPTERQQLLRPYFEPNEQEREEGAKQPTAAHRAIAHLASSNFVKVILTTNFDRLLEKALEDEGVAPDVLSSLDQVQNMRPLIHTQHCIFKIHGDYRDTRIRNTSSELQEYSEQFDRLLDQIFNDFGLIVCGWSAEWDGALRNALLRNTSRRFTTFWTTHGKAISPAQQIIDSRNAQTIPITSADEFFQSLQQQVDSLEQSSRAQPITTEVAVDRLKLYLAEPEYRIQLSDHINKTVERVVEATSVQSFDLDDPYPDRDSVTARVRAYESACATLLAMAAVGGNWVEEEHYGTWEQAVERLVDSPVTGGRQDWLALRKYPGMLLIYALGIGALHSDKLRFLGRIFKIKTRGETGINDIEFAIKRIADESGPATMIRRHSLLPGIERRDVQHSDWIHDALRHHFKQLIPSNQRYSLTFDRLEILIALAYSHLQNHSDLFPIGASVYRGAFLYRLHNTRRILQEIRESITNSGLTSPYVSSGIFGESPEECLNLRTDFISFVSEVARTKGISG